MATVVKRSGDEVMVAVTVRLGDSLLETEGAIQEATNVIKGSNPFSLESVRSDDPRSGVRNRDHHSSALP